MSQTSPNDYREQLDDINTGYAISLQQVIQLMPEYKLSQLNSSNPSSLFVVNQSNLTQRKNDISNLKANIEFDSTSLEQDIINKRAAIDIENEKNIQLNSIYQELLSTNNGAKGALFDTQLLYNQQYIGNLLLLSVILFYAKMIYTTYY
jgi:hypothetical protein